MKRLLLACLLCTSCLILNAQVLPDTSRQLNEIVVKAYFSDQPVLRSASSVSVIDDRSLSVQPTQSLVAVMNTQPGIRMEERSPGSYRLSIRGSLLRSPFGVRNVKIYMDGFPLTDAGGNTYLNLLDPANLSRIEILKGPESSVFGTNSGGVVLISPATAPRDSSYAAAQVSAGSYGLFHENVNFGKSWKNYDLNVSQAFQRSDGYRDNTALNRKYTHIDQTYRYSPTGTLKLFTLYSDLFYQLPGALTLAQAIQNPRAARPATPTIPGTVEDKAAARNKTFFGGISNENELFKNARFVFSLYGMHSDFSGPYITNYEFRNENTLGIRTYFDLNHFGKLLNWHLDLGYEGSETNSDIRDYDNNFGIPAAPQSSDKLKATQGFAFSHYRVDVGRLTAEAALSINFYKYHYQSFYPEETGNQVRNFNNQLMPRLALSYALSSQFAWRASVSRGYSPPTIAEILPSGNTINTALQAEVGWNYETGIRLQALDNRLYADVAVFNYRLQDAIVRRIDENEVEFYVNAGGTNQWGLESQLSFWLIRSRNSSLLRGLRLNSSYTLSDFKFRDYFNATDNYSGNRLTGVPRTNVVTSAEIQFPAALSLYLQHNYISRLPLNDANTFFANGYNLAQARLSWKKLLNNHNLLEVYTGADNILNANYSSGNDLNAVGNRFYNPAPPRNYYAGMAYRFSGK